ncbi:MAG: ATP-dependent DNA ligase [Gemmatimonadota bacterium]
MLLSHLSALSRSVAATPGRREKLSLIASFLGRLEGDEVEIAIGFLTGWPRQGRIGVGWAAASTAGKLPAAHEVTLTLRDVDRIFEALKSVGGRNSAAARSELLHDLFGRATTAEQGFLGALLVGEVRQGALEGVLLEAVARAAGVEPARLRRAVMLAGDLSAVAGPLLRHGESALDSYRLELFRPVQPMLADSATDVAEALAEPGVAIFEWKLDGARIQVHRQGDRVAVYTRALNEVTEAVPEVVEAVRNLPANELILDGEVIALTSGGRPLPFQTTMRRFGRRLDVESLRAEIPLTPFFFDLLLVDSDGWLDRPLVERLARLDELLPHEHRVPRLHTRDHAAASTFQVDALAQGHEGVMAKDPSSLYAAGRRGSAWLKIKTAHTLDLVILAVEWGSGRRQGWLSNLHLGARDPVNGGFVMLGKTFKGLTDEMLEWQTRELLARETHREGHVVHVRPELVAEIAFNEVQRSSQYPGGVALRFARVKGYRPDKSVSEADTIESVRAFLG